jgi:hypothetical protein
VSGTESTTPPPDEKRLTNRDRRPQPRKVTARAKFPLITAPVIEETRRQAAILRAADLDTSDPAAGGGRSFRYEWEEADAGLEQQIQTVAAGGGISYTHHQTTPAASWVIDHHMGLVPNVVLVDGSGQQMIAEIQYPSDQTIVVVHSAPYTGTAYLRP